MAIVGAGLADGRTRRLEAHGNLHKRPCPNRPFRDRTALSALIRRASGEHEHSPRFFFYDKEAVLGHLRLLDFALFGIASALGAWMRR